MSHTFKSYSIINWGYKLIISMFILSISTFNSPMFAQNTDENTGTKHTQNVLKFVVTKDTKDIQLEVIKEKLMEKKATVKFENIIRNDRKELNSIQIEFEHDGTKGNFFVNSGNPINDIAISLNVNENKLSVAETKRNLSQSFEVLNEDGQSSIKKPREDSNLFIYSTDDSNDKEGEKVEVVGKDGEHHEVKKEKKIYIMKSGSIKNNYENEDEVYIKTNKKDTIWIKKDIKNIIWTDSDGSEVEIIAVERGNNFQIDTNGEDQPLILLDGKEILNKDMDKVNPETIESVNVLKGEKAVEKHGMKGKHGVIEITSKKN